jgi:hypothetical protein
MLMDPLGRSKSWNALMRHGESFKKEKLKVGKGGLPPLGLSGIARAE